MGRASQGSGWRSVTLGWGRAPRAVEVPDDAVTLLPPPPPPARPWPALIAEALAAPIGSPPLDRLLAGKPRVCVIVPDETRKDVARRVLPLLRPLLAGCAVSVGVATGKHPPYAAPPGIDWVHDARAADLIPVGRTAHGTDVRFPPAVLEADLRVVVGEIRPHYFAGWAGGAKGLFPGVAGEAGIWHNHTLKAAPGARLGVLEGNPCRADMEAAAALAGPAFVINVVRGADGEPVAAVAGDPIGAHRAGVALARRVFEVPVTARFPVVVVSDRAPVTMNLYQACKLLPPAGAALADGGTVVLAAECAAGIGPVPVINEAIYRLGSVHSLPPRHRVVLVSDHPPEAVAPTFAGWAPSVRAAIEAAPGSGPGRVLVMPYGASWCLVRGSGPRSGMGNEPGARWGLTAR